MTERNEFMVFVDGKQSPQKVHASCPSAMLEAERLAKLNRGSVIRVLQVVKTLEPVHQWRDFNNTAF